MGGLKKPTYDINWPDIVNESTIFSQCLGSISSLLFN